MRKEDFAEVFGDINEKHIVDARADRKAKKPIWVKWGAMAACLCLVVGLAIPMMNNDISDQDHHSGLDSVKNPVYEVVQYTIPTDYVPADLYIATTTGLDEYDAHMVEHYGEKYQGKGVRVFTFVEGATTENFNVWYFDYEGTSISRIYYVTKSGDKLLTAWSDAGELGRAIEALASETSADIPMYLAQDNEIVFAIIGKIAYYLPNFTVMKPEVSQMLEIDTEGMEIKTISLLSGDYLEIPDKEADTVQFHDKTLNKSDLSADTLEWLEKYNSLSREEQLAISSIPSDLYELCGYGKTENTETNGPAK